MDTSKTYIKMCEKAEEIQANWEPSDLDCMAKLDAFYGYDTAVVCACCSKSTPSKDTYWWLPRQDQLQEIVSMGENLEAFHVGHGNQIRYQLEQFCYDSDLNYTNQFTSMEQLWLAFVMKIKYDKCWNGKEWVISYAL